MNLSNEVIKNSQQFLAVEPRYAGGADLPLELYLDNILPLLAIEDVLTLRRTCKLFLQLTRSSDLWESFLQRLPCPHPPLFPDTVFAGGPAQNVSNAELAVKRAVSAKFLPIETQEEFSWLSVQLDLKRVCAMKLLPGGVHLVTVEELLDGRYTMSLWEIRDLDLRPRRHVQIPLPRSVAPEGIDAIYTTFDGTYGVVMGVLQNDAVESDKGVVVNPNTELYFQSLENIHDQPGQETTAGPYCISSRNFKFHSTGCSQLRIIMVEGTLWMTLLSPDRKDLYLNRFRGKEEPPLPAVWSAGNILNENDEVLDSPMVFYDFLPLDKLSLIVVRSVSSSMGDRSTNTFIAVIYDDLRECTPGWHSKDVTMPTRNLQLKVIRSSADTTLRNSKWSISTSFRHFDVSDPEPSFASWRASGRPLLLHHEYFDNQFGETVLHEVYHLYPNDFEPNPNDSGEPELRRGSFLSCLDLKDHRQQGIFHGQEHFIAFRHYQFSVEEEERRVMISRELYEPRCADVILGCRDDPTLVPATRTRPPQDFGSYTDLPRTHELYKLLSESPMKLGDWDDNGIGRFVFVAQKEGEESSPFLVILDYAGC